MISRFAPLAAVCCALAALPVMAQTPPTAPVVAPDRAGLVRVTLTTTMGPIALDLDAHHAPLTTANFLRYVDQKRFDGINFYRTMRLSWGTPEKPEGLIQAGTRGDPKRTLKPVAHESTSVTGLLHKAGAISMARFAPGTATGDFSILVSDLTSLDAHPDAPGPGDNAGYAVFGYVVEGMNVVRQIHAAPVSPTAGEGALKGQMLAPPIKIISARRTKP
jgi:peptidyl-prolyl cis-trans isomerase A (cyclophilin A)